MGVSSLSSRSAVWGLCALCAALLAPACSQQAATQNRRGGPAVAVRTTTVQRMAVQRQVDLAGTLLSPDQARVSAEAAGVVRSVLVDIGREVRAGDPLVRIDEQELKLAAARAESALRQTRAQLGMHGALDGNDTPPADDDIGSVRNALASREDARAAAERAKALSARGLISPVDLQTAETRLKVAEAAYQSAVDNARGQKALLQDRRAAYDLAVKQLKDAIVRAPISGIVSERLVQVGEFIGERTPVATIVQIDPLKLRTGVQERHAGVIQPGLEVQFRVESFGDQVFRGRIEHVSPALDQTMRTFTVEAIVDNTDRRLKPGFFAKGVILTRKDDNVMAVPDSAVSTFAGVSSVYVVKDGRITQQTVELGVRQQNLWEILGGLKGDETLANSRLNELATGVRVDADNSAAGSGGARGGGGRRGQGGAGRSGRRGPGGGGDL
ncbi:MAG TPA: efflux RND transporter periplasmic adaptor subunit [Vicinamibacterales bacterium]|nr:efflux RND transporter periplasmic adaptor subunit [Vicinamibacterales bacterium]